MSREKFDTKKNVERILRISLFGVLVRLILNAFANVLSASASLHTIFIDASLDVVLSIVSLFVLGMMRRKSSTHHPYGYGKIEYIWNFVQGGTLLGFNVLLACQTLRAFFHAKAQKINEDSTYLMLASAVLTALICILEYRGWKKSQSSLIYCNYLNHLMDVFVYLAGCLGVWASNKGFQNLDGVIALLIAIVVGYEGFSLCRQAIGELCDRSLGQAQLKELQEDLWRELCLPLGWEFQTLKSRRSGIVQFLEVDLKVPGDLKLNQILLHLEPLKSLWKKKFSGLEPLFSLNLIETGREFSNPSILKD